MKARNHLSIHIVIAILISLAYFYIGSFNHFFNSLISPYKDSILVLAIGIGLYFLGAILPDADGFNRGSYIYYTKFAFLAYIVRFLEYPLAILTGRRKGHRESLHTIFGIVSTSVAIALMTSIIYSLFYNTKLFSPIFFFWAISLSIGQFLHLVEDKIVSPKWKIKLI